MSVPKHNVLESRLLAALPERGRHEFAADCELVELSFAAVVGELGQRIRHVYFPLDSFISLVTTLNDGARLEVGIIGDEGMLGTSLLLGVNTSPEHALVQGAGLALRMSASAFNAHCAQNPALRQRLHLYIYVLMGQMAQTAACARYHVVEARLARWLLLTRDRAHSDQFRLTHEFLAYMLGVRRVGITEAARDLHARGLIDYARGKISILDGTGLEKAACGCYEQGNALWDRSLGLKSARRVTDEP